MDYTDKNLTNEQVKKRFKNQFELVGYAIKLAENMIRTGRASRITSESQNPAMLTLGEIEAGVDHFDEIPVEVDHSFQVSERITELKNEEAPSKPTERKRARKILVD